MARTTSASARRTRHRRCRRAFSWSAEPTPTARTSRTPRSSRRRSLRCSIFTIIAGKSSVPQKKRINNSWTGTTFFKYQSLQQLPMLQKSLRCCYISIYRLVPLRQPSLQIFPWSTTEASLAPGSTENPCSVAPSTTPGWLSLPLQPLVHDFCPPPTNVIGSFLSKMPIEKLYMALYTSNKVGHKILSTGSELIAASIKSASWSCCLRLEGHNSLFLGLFKLGTLSWHLTRAKQSPLKESKHKGQLHNSRLESCEH